MKKAASVTVPALERLQADAPEGPPFLGLLLDVPTMQALSLGVVNSRAEVAAKKALAAYEGTTPEAVRAS